MSVSEFFKSKHIFITGGTGFIGKVLIEKLLRSCSGVEKIYVLLRAKKDKSIEERLKSITDCKLFDKLKKIRPETIEKLVPISGDLSKLKLGLSERDFQVLIENVDIIYHGAASIRFDDHLKDSILLNTRGMREVIDLALQAKKLVTFVHISTTYCNCDKKVIEEKLYPPLANWESTIKIAEQTDQDTLNILAPHYIHPLPNTYTFSKSLSEHVVYDLCKGKLLAAIVRPSVVVPTLDDPIAGWVDNFNGPIGLLCATAKGILKTTYVDKSIEVDCIPVDILIKFILLVTYEKTLSENLDEVSVYNATATENATMAYGDMVKFGERLIWDAPYPSLFWYPSHYMTNNWYLYYILFFLYTMLPAIIVDGVRMVTGQKPMFSKVQRKVYIANIALIFFMRNSWRFMNSKCMALKKHIVESEIQTFSFAHFFDFSVEDKYAFYIKAKMMTSLILFNEEFNREKGYKLALILWILNYLLRITIFGVLCWFFITKIKILTISNNIINSYLHYLNEL